MRLEADRDHAAPAPVTRPVMSAIPAIRPMIEVDAMYQSVTLGSRNGSQAKQRQSEDSR
jgi:hypothetical protein